MINFIVGTLMGILFYRIFSRIYGASVSTMMLRVAELYCLRLLVSAHDDLVFLKETKINIMKDLKLTENQIKVAKNIDEVHIKRWKHKAIHDLLARYPDSFRSKAQYHDWNSAMNHLQKIIKKT